MTKTSAAEEDNKGISRLQPPGKMLKQKMHQTNLRRTKSTRRTPLEWKPISAKIEDISDAHQGAKWSYLLRPGGPDKTTGKLRRLECFFQKRKQLEGRGQRPGGGLRGTTPKGRAQEKYFP